MTDLGSLDGRDSIATAINDSGQVVGFSSVTVASSIVSHAFIAGPNGIGMTDLGTLGRKYSEANGINDSGQVVGSFYDYRGVYEFSSNEHAFITGPNGVGMTDLGTLGGNFSRAYAINNSGEAVGVSTTATGEIHSFIFSHGGMTDLSLLAPVAAGWADLYARSINNNGQIVGYGYNNHDHTYEAFLLSPTTAVPELETYLMLLGGLGLIGYFARRTKEIAI